MLKNKLIELANFSPKSSLIIGSKLKQNLLNDTPQPIYNPKYSQAFDLIQKMNICTNQINQNKKYYLKAANPKKQSQINEKIKQIVTKNNASMHKLDQLVKQISSQYKEQQKNGNKQNYVQYTNVTKRSNAAIQDFKDAQQNYTKQIKDTIRRQARQVKSDLTEQQLTQIIAQPQKGQQLVEMQLFNVPSEQLTNAVSDILDKCRDIVNLEKSMHQCLDMMRELGILVQQQGMRLDTIEMAIDGAQNYMDIGQVKLNQAKILHKKGNKKMCCIIMLVLAAIGVVVIPIVITQLK